MVRLVVTDFATKEDSEFFYVNGEFDVSQNMFTYNSFKRYNVYLPKYQNDEIYSLNLLSRKYLDKNQFLIHIADAEFVIKSILITKHIAMLSSGGAIENIYYVINSKYKGAIENILKQNTKNERQEVVAKSLGEIDDLVKQLNELDTFKSHSSKLFYMGIFLAAVLWTVFGGLEKFTDKIFFIEPLEGLTNELKIEGQLSKRQEILLNNSEKRYHELVDCITSSKEVSQ